MTKEEIRQFARNSQSAPFRINLADSRSFLVAHPEFIAFPREQGSFVFFPEDGGLEWIAIDQVVSLSRVPLRKKAAKSSA